jgi:hypothetical protein
MLAPAAFADSTVDTVAPTSTTSSVASTHAKSFTVSYSVSDPAPSSGIAQVDLYGEFPGQASWHELGYRVEGATTGSFEITPPTPGVYHFRVVARDNAGNQELLSDTPATTTLSIDDNTPPDGLGTVVVYEAKRRPWAETPACSISRSTPAPSHGAPTTVLSAAPSSPRARPP